MRSSQEKAGTAIDWQKVRERLDKVGKALEQGQRLTPQRAQDILQDRARLLARVPPQAPPATEVVEVAVFRLGKEQYALQTDYIREVIHLRDCTPLPGTPGYLVGVTNLRGQILPVFDLRVFFDLPAPDLTEEGRVLIVGQDRTELGFLTDAVVEVSRPRTDEFLEPQGLVTGSSREWVRGITAGGLILLNGGVMLKDPRLYIDLEEDQ